MHKGSFVRKLLLTLALFIAAYGLLGMMPWPQTRHDQRLGAETLWNTRPFANYRVTVQIERLQHVCFQELEVQGDKVHTLNDTCDMSWLASMTVSRLFELSSWMEQGPDCYPSVGNCSCQRVRLGRIAYDPQLGYPREIVWQRKVQANVDHLDFWQRLWEAQSLPNCSAAMRPVRIVVLSLAPLP